MMTLMMVAVYPDSTYACRCINIPMLVHLYFEILFVVQVVRYSSLNAVSHLCIGSGSHGSEVVAAAVPCDLSQGVLVH